MKYWIFVLLIMLSINIRKYKNYNLNIKLKPFTNKIYMSSRVQLKSTKLQHRKRPRKRKKSEIYRTPVLYNPNQKDYFNLQSEYICLPDIEILNLLSKNRLHALVNAIKNKDNDQINNILYKDVNNIYIDSRYIYYYPSFINNEKNENNLNEFNNYNKQNKINYQKNSIEVNDISNNEDNQNHQLWNHEKNYILKNNNFNKNYIVDIKKGNENETDNNNEDNTKFVDINNIYFYFKKVNITNINKDNINDDIYKELKELKKISMEKGDPIGYNIYKYFLNIITNVDRFKYIDDFFLVDYINNVWENKNIHKYFYFLNSLYDRMKKISYKLFNLNYKIDQIDHIEEKNKMIYFERHELFNKIIKKTKFIPNYILKHNYIYSNNIFNLYQYDIKSNSFVNKFDSTYTPVLLTDFFDPEKKKNLNIYYNLNTFDSFKTYAHTYPRNNQLKKVMQITYGKDENQNEKGENQNEKDENQNGKDENQNGKDENQNGKDENNNMINVKNMNNSNEDKQNNGLNNHSSWIDRIKRDKKIKYEILEKISEKMHSEFLEMKVIDNQNKIDLNKIDDIKNDKNSLLYKKVYAMRDYFYNLIYDNYKPNLDIYELETFIDAEYRTYSYKKDLDILFKHWVLNENKQLPTIQFAKKDVQLAKTRLMSKRKRKIIEFDQLVYERHCKLQKEHHNDESHQVDNNQIYKKVRNEKEKGKQNDNCQDKVIKKSINCLIKWNVRSENDSNKRNKPNDDYNDNDYDNDCDNDYDNDYDDENENEDTDLIDFDKYDIQNEEIKSYGFCDEELEEYDNDSTTPFYNMKFAKLVIYDDNYNKTTFVETLMKYIQTCDYQRASDIYNSLKVKGKIATLYFKNYERAENIAFLLRQSPEKIIVDVELL
ncbi:conserved Plasmodium protein, unknown function [Plasmodium berghei]|uniref:Uncharacterized protein n=2 Tax=Plasmodium berghei TaxID=5821 RepID=A0A509ACN2_PLABA|nr:conserved protein, unknown function [Plasmodium berghei ANKA]CXH89183.1 conserved Plasmodium protein, unknown function [Plasmodium berghei]SCL90304.1 conserved Plasmodium protein, unknown function [Plasmodium berghei]SCM15263.1 conserved Plasmodium protein, unknown function [Plasmodium berghei]SCM17058.1 conserved Plasmodium protein, unknown function [Plasmodium berghei]SCN21947.1 conserved Plasmodium protein, unknown function [Plasmodium berghei]|eukprot:XP_034419838.1 conserved protein, unknown function [Plasmodium berghei ANKA]